MHHFSFASYFLPQKCANSRTLTRFLTGLCITRVSVPFRCVSGYSSPLSLIDQLRVTYRAYVNSKRKFAWATSNFGVPVSHLIHAELLPFPRFTRFYPWRTFIFEITNSEAAKTRGCSRCLLIATAFISHSFAHLHVQNHKSCHFCL